MKKVLLWMAVLILHGALAFCALLWTFRVSSMSFDGRHVSMVEALTSRLLSEAFQLPFSYFGSPLGYFSSFVINAALVASCVLLLVMYVPNAVSSPLLRRVVGLSGLVVIILALDSCVSSSDANSGKIDGMEMNVKGWPTGGIRVMFPDGVKIFSLGQVAVELPRKGDVVLVNRSLVFERNMSIVGRSYELEIEQGWGGVLVNFLNFIGMFALIFGIFVEIKNLTSRSTGRHRRAGAAAR